MWAALHIAVRVRRCAIDCKTQTENVVDASFYLKFHLLQSHAECVLFLLSSVVKLEARRREERSLEHGGAAHARKLPSLRHRRESG